MLRHSPGLTAGPTVAIILQALTFNLRPSDDPPMTPDALRRAAYGLAALLASVYGVYVVVLKLMHRVTGGPLGELGEFLLVLACVTAFCVALFADEALRNRRPG